MEALVHTGDNKDEVMKFLGNRCEFIPETKEILVFTVDDVIDGEIKNGAIPIIISVGQEIERLKVCDFTYNIIRCN